MIRIEACFLSKVSPWRRVADLEPEEALQLVRSSRWIMETAIERGARPKQIYGLKGLEARGGPPATCPRCGGRVRIRGPGGRQPRHLLVRGLPELSRAAGARRPGGYASTPPSGDNRRRMREAEANVAELLAHVPLLSGLSEPELERIAQVAVPRAIPEGGARLPRGRRQRRLLRDPRRRGPRHPRASDGRAIALATLGAGEIVGELAMLDGEVRSASVEALTDVELLAIAAVDMRGLLERNPEITAKLVVALTRRVRETNERVARQSFQTVPSRVAGVLSQLVAEAAPTCPAATGSRSG